jgi:hypothetical protein
LRTKPENGTAMAWIKKELDAKRNIWVKEMKWKYQVKQR